MTRKSKREIGRALDALESRYDPTTDAALLVAPDSAAPPETLPDVDTDGIRATDPETGRETVVVPHHRPGRWWAGRLPVVTESHVAAIWETMTAEQYDREREIREQHGHPIPPVLEKTET
jgi:hypothetical protein